VAHDGVRLAAPRLAVREDGAVVAVPSVGQHAETQVREHLHLSQSATGVITGIKPGTATTLMIALNTGKQRDSNICPSRQQQQHNGLFICIIYGSMTFW